MSSSSRRLAPRQVPPPEGSSLQPSHARFIPREELTSFASWTPGPLGSGAAAAPGASRVSGGLGPTPTPAPTSEPGLSAQELDALQRAARQAGYHDGYRDGMAALENFKRSFAQQMAAQVGQIAQTFNQELQSLESDMAQAVVNAATGLARQIIRQELSTQPELVIQVAREAIAALSQAARRMELRVHPDDLALVQAGLGEDLSARGVVCTADASIARGGCRVLSELGTVDAQIDSQWALALHRLGLNPSDWPLPVEDGF